MCNRSNWVCFSKFDLFWFDFNFSALIFFAVFFLFWFWDIDDFIWIEFVLNEHRKRGFKR